MLMLESPVAQAYPLTDPVGLCQGTALGSVWSHP